MSSVLSNRLDFHARGCSPTRFSYRLYGQRLLTADTATLRFFFAQEWLVTRNEGSRSPCTHQSFLDPARGPRWAFSKLVGLQKGCHNASVPFANKLAPKMFSHLFGFKFGWVNHFRARYYFLGWFRGKCFHAIRAQSGHWALWQWLNAWTRPAVRQ